MNTPAAIVATPAQPAAVAALLLLADGRLPAGGHAHSGGLEAAVASEGLREIEEIEAFLRGRAHTTGRVTAAFAAAACTAASAPDLARLLLLDEEFDARVPSPTLRGVSRRLGRQLLRTGRQLWPDGRLGELGNALPAGPHHAVALGATAAAAGIGPAGAASAAVYESVATPAAAAVRLLGLDPFGVYGTLARIGPELDRIAASAATRAESEPSELPACSTPLLDLLAEQHASWEVRLFAS